MNPLQVTNFLQILRAKLELTQLTYIWWFSWFLCSIFLPSLPIIKSGGGSVYIIIIFTSLGASFCTVLSSSLSDSFSWGRFHPPPLFLYLLLGKVMKTAENSQLVSTCIMVRNCIKKLSYPFADDCSIEIPSIHHPMVCWKFCSGLWVRGDSGNGYSENLCFWSCQRVSVRRW